MPTLHELSAALDERLPRTGDLVAGAYRIDGFIGRGGMGAVLAATQTATGRRVALKWVICDRNDDESGRQRLAREAQAMARVEHPNVVSVYDVGTHDGASFIVMELLEGETLAALVKERGVLGARQTIELLVPAMRGIEAAHRHRIVHRDLKPSNIFLCRDGNGGCVPRVLDFGISKVISHTSDAERSLTDTGFVLGTPHYMAPEHLRGETIDARADIYALGVILYRCLAGRLPFRESNYNALVVQIVTQRPPPISQLRPHLPVELAAVVMRAMAKDPDDRFQTVGELVAALAPFGRDAQTTEASREPYRGRKLALALAVVALASALCWAIFRQ